ncbi:MAG: hypothetical protein AAGF26_17560 [Cyanobacteria bacterium P01_G01_bin.49]
MDQENFRTQSQDKAFTQISALLFRYGFDLNGVSITQLIQEWSADYSVYWIRLGIIEALYQGRYKAISIQQILRLWQRRGQATYHFSYDFERLITEKFVINDWSKKLTETKSFSEKVTNQEEIAFSSQPSRSLTPIQELVKEIEKAMPIISEDLSANSQNYQIRGDLTFKKIENQEKITQIDVEDSYHVKNSDRSILQFIPNLDPSKFYQKLRAVAYQKLSKDKDNALSSFGIAE